MKVKDHLVSPGSVVAESEDRKFPGCFRGLFLTAKAWRHTYTTLLPWPQRKRPHWCWVLRGHASLLNISAFVLVSKGKSFLSCKRWKSSRNRIRPAWKSHFPPGRISEHADNCSWAFRIGSIVILPVCWNSCLTHDAELGMKQQPLADASVSCSLLSLYY